ncbi:MAG: DUF512 domain-containing protein [Eubacterium sp.]|nr:DUF512 domain-containing protein [Eubacterium sp.]
MEHVIKKIIEGSIACELELEPGDVLLEMNGCKIEDIFDYQYHMENEYLELLVRKKDEDEEWLLEIEKDEDEDLGIVFESNLMDSYRSCRNQCVFCFIDQMPPGMRETLYFKDDDSRLSFLQGNYVTLTNMSDHDIDRIIRYHLAPINISFHTTNPQLRCEMLHNRFAGEALEKAGKLAKAGISLNGQIVLCRGLNDGPELDRTLGDLASFLPALQSVSVVPVGLTDYREGLYPLEAFTGDDAREVLRQIHAWQERFLEKYGTRLVHASDEWYLLAGEPLPPAAAYEGYQQLENGVGMLRLLQDEVAEYLRVIDGDARSRCVSIATGELAAPLIRGLAQMVHEKFPAVFAMVYPIRNDFFGNRITVSGLITGQDLSKQMQTADKGECLLIPSNMLRYGENVFLDDMTLEDVSCRLGVPVRTVDAAGRAFVDALLGEAAAPPEGRQMYEQTDCSNYRPPECGKVDTV